MRKLLISHTDLDGLGAIVLAKLYNDVLQFDDMICRDYDFELDEEQFEVLKTFNEIVIADLSMCKEKTEELRQLGIKILFFDHHEKANWLAEDPDAVFSMESSGTKLFWNSYVKTFIKRYPPIVEEFVTLVDTYDLWKQDDLLWEEAKNLNYLLYGTKNYNETDNIVASEKFIDLLEKKFRYQTNWYLTPREREIVDRSNKKEQEVFEKSMKNLQVRIDKKGKLFGLFPIASKISIVCSRILKEEENLDYIVAVNSWGGINGKLSFRSRNGFNCNDLEVAGGHSAAAGAMISADLALKVLEDPAYAFTYKEDFTKEDEKTAVEKVN